MSKISCSTVGELLNSATKSLRFAEFNWGEKLKNEKTVYWVRATIKGKNKCKYYGVKIFPEEFFTNLEPSKRKRAFKKELVKLLRVIYNHYFAYKKDLIKDFMRIKI